MRKGQERSRGKGEKKKEGVRPREVVGLAGTVKRMLAIGRKRETRLLSN